MPDERADSAGPVFIVMNAGSGDKDAQGREQTVREILSAAGRPHRVWSITDAGELRDAARQAVELARQQQGMVVAAGGDGTINTVAQAVLGSGCVFGVLPQGTFNYFGRAHAIPVDTAEATRILLNGVVRPVQVGLVNDRIFLVNASLGLYPKLLEKREEHKHKFGRTRLVAMYSALTAVLTPPPQLVISLEGGGEKGVMHVSTLLVMNSVLQLQEVGLEEARVVQQGQLAAVAVKAQGVLQMLYVVALAALGKLGVSERVSSFSFTALKVDPLRRRRIKVATDGEVNWMVPPLVFKVAPHPLFLVMPAPAETPPVPS